MPDFNRTIAISALVGSHNYNLNNERSDKDYKYFVYPTFDDLYTGKFYAHGVTSETVDYTAHDIRKLGELIYKANINFIEVLFSKEINYDSILSEIFKEREKFAMINPVGFYFACMGMYRMKMDNLFKGTETTKPLIEKFGYDTKEACHAVRCLITVCRYINFNSMAQTLWFNGNSDARRELMGIKNGEYTIEEFQRIATNWYNYASAYEGDYKLMPVNMEAKNRLDEIIKFAVKREVENAHL